MGSEWCQRPAVLCLATMGFVYFSITMSPLSPDG